MARKTITTIMNTITITDTREERRRLRKRRLLLAGLGNELLSDDGVGIHAVRELASNVPKGVLAVDVGTAVLDALHLFEWADVVIAIDAMQAGGAPGTVYSFGTDDVAEAGVQASLHELSLVGALGFLPPDARPQVAIIGVEPGKIDYSLELTPEVQAALPRVVEEVRRLVILKQGR